MITSVLLIAGAVCFGLAAFGVSIKGLNLTALGLFCWILTLLVR